MSAPSRTRQSLVDRQLPPVTEIGAASMIAIAGRRDLPRLVPAEARSDSASRSRPARRGSAAGDERVLLSGSHDFAWKRFFQVGRWSLLAYAVIAGMIEFAFVYDHTRGAQLVVMTLMLVLFMLNVPVLIAFTVARYERV